MSSEVSKIPFPIGCKRSCLLQLLITLLLTGAVLFYFNSTVILSPNSTLQGPSGDAIKSYFCTVAQLHDSTSAHQLGLMNYPYGQTFLYTDGQASMMWLIRLADHFFPDTSHYTIGIINSFYFISWLLCALFLFLIIRRLGLPWHFNILGTLAITLLSPQLFRVLGHPTLCYVMFFPFSWWLFIRFMETKKKLFVFTLLLLNSLFWNFIHPYYLAEINFFYILIWMVGYLQKRILLKDLLRWGIPMFVLPFLITQFYIHVYDFHTHRSSYPYGFWNQIASFFSVFTPTTGPFLSLFRYFFGSAIQQNWEGWSYIGLPATCIFGLCLVKLFRYIRKKDLRKITRPVYPSILSIAFWPAIILLLYSMCFPFNYGLQILYDLVGPLRQFRALGRFAWIFFYVFNVFALYTFYLIWRYLNLKNLKVLAKTFYISFFFLMISEGIAQQSEVAGHANGTPNYFILSGLKSEQRETIDVINKIKSKYQAMICIPYYHVGSENFSKEFSDNSITSSLIFSYWSGLPLVNSSSARSPMLEARNIMQLPGPSFIHKDIEKDLPNKKSFLVLFTKEDINNQEQVFLSRCKPIYNSEHYQLFEISYNDLFTAAVDYSAEIKEKKPLTVFPNLIVDGDTFNVVYQNYDTQKSNMKLEGAGAVQGIKKNYISLLTEFPLRVSKDVDFLVSFWYYNKDELRLQNNCIIEERDSLGNNANWIKQNPCSESLVIAGDWSLVEFGFKTTRENPKITVVLNGPSNSSQEVYVDNFLLRKWGTKVYRIQSDVRGQRKISFDNLPPH